MKRSELRRLTINLSHDCNLRCRYCYADSGSYRGPRRLLSIEKGRQIIDYFSAVYDNISNIQFFGGEPLLNFHIIGPLCDYIFEVFGKKCSSLPVLSVVTNGTILNKTIVNMIRKYQICVTVSLDGLASINDCLRVYKNGSGSFNRIVSNIQILSRETGQPMRIEGTFTSEHLHQNFSLVEFMDYLVKELKIHSLHMPWVIGNCYNGCGIVPNNKNIEKIISIYSEAFSKSLHSLISPDINQTILTTYIERYLERFFAKFSSTPYICPAGIDTLSVSADGSVYPCFLFISNKKFKLAETGTAPVMDLTKNKRQFSKDMKVPQYILSNGDIPLMFCAGLNYICNGSLTKIPDHEMTLSRALNSCLKDELDHLMKNREDRDWIHTKLILYNALLGIKE